jgi:hypothetical protein
MKVENKYKHNSRISSIKPYHHRFLAVRAYRIHPRFMVIQYSRGLVLHLYQIEEERATAWRRGAAQAELATGRRSRREGGKAGAPLTGLESRGAQQGWRVLEEHQEDATTGGQSGALPLDANQRHLSHYAASPVK